MIRRLETKLYVERLKELGMFILEKRSLKRYIALFKYLKGGDTEAGSSQSAGHIIMGSGYRKPELG